MTDNTFDALVAFFGDELLNPAPVAPQTIDVEPQTVPFWQVCGYPDEQSYNRVAARFAADVREAHFIANRRERLGLV